MKYLVRPFHTRLRRFPVQLASARLCPQSSRRSPDDRHGRLAWSSIISDPKLVLLHIGQKAEYDAGHIPGARFVTLEDIELSRRRAISPFNFRPPTVSKRARKIGISNDSRIIIYLGKDWVSPTTRVYFTLDYFGLGSEHFDPRRRDARLDRRGKAADERCRARKTGYA